MRNTDFIYLIPPLISHPTRDFRGKTKNFDNFSALSKTHAIDQTYRSMRNLQIRHDLSQLNGRGEMI